MIKTIKLSALSLAALAALAVPTLSAPTLKASISVNSAIVTVGDMFSGAHTLAEQPLFRAPRPGTAGQVSLSAIKTAAARVGLTDFDNPGYLSVTVARSGTRITAKMLEDAISRDLDARGVISSGQTPRYALTSQVDELFATDSANPFDLSDLRYDARTGEFAASFAVAGQPTPYKLMGRVDMMISAPYLKNSLPAGAIVSADDVQMRQVPEGLARNGALPTLDQIVGMQLKRPAREGMMLTDNDLAAPQLIARNDTVTLTYRVGALTLTARGKALGNAAKGDTISVLNLASKKVISGIATASGTVSVSPQANG